MAQNLANGVMRIEKQAGTTSVLSIAPATYNFSTSTVEVTNNLASNLRVLGIQANISMKQNVAGTATGQFFNLFIDDKPVASYVPADSNQRDWFVSEIVPLDYVTNPQSRFYFQYALASETGDYGVVAGFKVFSIEN